MKKITIAILLITIVLTGAFANSKTDESGFALETGYGNGTGGLGITVEYFSIKSNPNLRSCILIGIGLWPDSLMMEWIKPSIGFTFGIRNFEGNGNHSFVTEFTYGTVIIVTLMNKYGYYEPAAFYGPTAALGYQYMSDEGFIITATTGVSTIIAEGNFIDIWLPTLTISSGFKF